MLIFASSHHLNNKQKHQMRNLNGSYLTIYRPSWYQKLITNFRGAAQVTEVME